MSGYFDTCPDCIAGTPRAPAPERKYMLTQAHEDLRLECLRLASSGFNEFPGDTVRRAQAYFDFLTGKSDQSPRQVIEAALEAANVR